MIIRLAFCPLLLVLTLVSASARTPPPLQPLPDLDVAAYMGTWYQVLWIPNRFQRQCIAETSATYRELGDGTVAVTNRCRDASGTMDSVQGVARPVAAVSKISAGALQPARLEVSFLPVWLRWIGIGWGAYWVVDLPPDGRYAIVSEATREYLWVLSRKPVLTSNDDKRIRNHLRLWASIFPRCRRTRKTLYRTNQTGPDQGVALAETSDSVRTLSRHETRLLAHKQQCRVRAAKRKRTADRC